MIRLQVIKRYSSFVRPWLIRHVDEYGNAFEGETTIRDKGGMRVEVVGTITCYCKTWEEVCDYIHEKTEEDLVCVEFVNRRKCSDK